MFRAIRNARNEFNSVCQYCKHSWNSPFLTWKIKRKIYCLILFRIRVQNFLINLMREEKKGTTPTESTFDEVDQTCSTKFFSLYETFPKTRKILQLFISMEFGHHEVCTFTIWIVLLSSFLCHKRLRSFFFLQTKLRKTIILFEISCCGNEKYWNIQQKNALILLSTMNSQTQCNIIWYH